MKYALTLLAALLLAPLSALHAVDAAAGGLAGTRLAQTSDWYEKTFIHTHHSTGDYAPEWDTQFESLRPDAAQFHMGAYEVGKRLSEKYGFAFVATLNASGGWTDGNIVKVREKLPKQEQRETFFQRVNPDGSPAGRMRGGELWRHLCYYSPGIKKYIYPLYAEQAKIYQPAQIWIDHNVITVNLCYCERCRKNFQTQFGVTAPEKSNDPLWNEWVAYHRKGFENWMRDISGLVKSNAPGCLVTFNHAYFITQPEPPPPFIGNFSADLHSQLLEMCLFSRYAATMGVPFDIMPGLTDRWAGKIPKGAQEVLQAAATITANGGRWNIGELPASRDKQPADEMLKLAKAGADFVRERQAWTQHTKPAPLVAVLQAAATQYARVIPRTKGESKEGIASVVSDSGRIETVAQNGPGMTRIYWHDNRPVPLEVYGACEALLENNIPFDIINEATAKQRLPEYRLLIVGDQFRLDSDTLSAIRLFVKNGGGLLATGRTIESGLAETLGISSDSIAPLQNAVLKIGAESFTLPGGVKVKADGADMKGTFAGSTRAPAILAHKLGKGRSLYVAGDFFRMYADASPYTVWAKTRTGNATLRRTVADWIAEIVPDLGYSCSAPPWIEVAFRIKSDALLIHFVERTHEWRNDLYEVKQPITLSLALNAKPGQVLLHPGSRPVEWKWQEEKLQAAIPIDQIRTHSILEIRGAY